MIIKINSKISHILVLQFIIAFTVLLSACGETIKKESGRETNEKVASDIEAAKGNTSSIDTITLAGGCFWCVEAIYQRLDGVVSTLSGYSGGKVKNPTYMEVCTGKTGHAESEQIVFDTTKTSFEEILKVFFSVHDPTTLNRQGADVGTQYRSAIFYRNDHQRKIAQGIIDDLTNENVYPRPIVTQLVPYTNFYKAEDYHQNYYNQNKNAPYCRVVIQPKLEKFEQVFSDRLKK